MTSTFHCMIISLHCHQSFIQWRPYGSLRSHLLHLMSPLNKATDTVGKYEDGVSSSTYSIIRCLLRYWLKINFKVQSIIDDLNMSLTIRQYFTNLIQKSRIFQSSTIIVWLICCLKYSFC